MNNILQHWERYIIQKNGKIEQRNSANIYNRYKEYIISYKNEYEFTVIIHIQQEPERGRGAYLEVYTKIYTAFTNKHSVSLNINKKNFYTKFFEKIISAQNDLFSKLFYVRSNTPTIKEEIKKIHK